MKALTIAQPWATLVAIGEKTVETRSWKTSYRGEIAIHAGKGLRPSGGQAGLTLLCNTRPFQRTLYKEGFVTHNHCDFDAEPTAKMEFGAIIGVAELYDIVPAGEMAQYLSEMELASGHYSPGRFAWLLRNARQIKPVPVKGRLGLWEVNLQT